MTITGDGIHTLDVFGTAANDLPARITVTVKIDGTAPTTSAAATRGKLTLSANGPRVRRRVDPVLGQRWCPGRPTPPR